MQHYILRNFDAAWYYETRLILAILALGVCIWRLRRHHDSRFLVMFLSGVFWQGANELILQALSLRGPQYRFAVFGHEMSGLAGNLFQGITEGGIFAVMGVWILALRIAPGDRSLRRAYVGMCVVIIVLASVVGVAAHGRDITSARPLFRWDNQIWVWSRVSLGIALTAWRGRFRDLGYFYLGLLIYGIITFETLHVLGARYVGVRALDGQFSTASPIAQVLVMCWSQLVDIAASKIHYFAVPCALGWIRQPDKKKA